MKLDATDLATLSRLLDEMLDLPPAERTAWLDRLPEPSIRFVPHLRHALDDNATPATASAADAVLDALPALSRQALDAGFAQVAGMEEGATVGRYRLQREIGRGGMGAVWLAEPIEGGLKRAIALKLPHPSLYSAELAERFARERDILAGLTHPNIARLYDAGVSATGQPYLALEYIEGVPITTYCDERRLDVAERIALFQQVLRAVQYAHTKLVVHRDLKPSNILVSADGVVHLLDFGIAKLVAEAEGAETELTRIAGRALTLDYASPEQIAGEPISTASDVYSLGVILYELLTGARPYRPRRDTRGALEDSILTDQARRPSQAVDGTDVATVRSSSPQRLSRALAGDLDTIVLKALNKEAAERYPTAEALAQDIERWQNGLPVLAQPESRRYRLRKFVLRNKLGVAAGVAFVVVIGAGLGVSLWQAHVARQEAQTSSAVRAFLRDIFAANAASQSDPVKARQRTARELLDIGAERIETNLVDAPAAKLEVLATLADMYIDMGEMERAAAVLRRQIALAREVEGPNSIWLARGLTDLGLALASSKDVAEREKVLNEASAILDRNGNPNTQLRARLLRQFVGLYSDRDPAKSLAYAEQAIAVSRQLGDARGTVEALMRKGGSLMRLDDYSGGEAAYRDALEVSKTMPRQGAELLPKLHSYLGEAQYLRNDLESAETNFRAALAAAIAQGGPDYMDALQTRMRLGSFLAETSRLAEGVSLLRDDRDRVLLKLPAGETFLRFWVQRFAGGALVDAGLLEEGGETIAQAVAVERSRKGNGDALAAALAVQAAWALETGRMGEAEQMLAEIDAIRARLQRIPSARLNAMIGARAAWANASGRGDEALQSLEAFHVDAPPRGDATRTWSQAMVVKAEANLAAGRPEVARAVAAEARERLAASKGRVYYLVHEARAGLVEGKALLALQRAQEAKPILATAVEQHAALFDPASPRLADARITLSNCLLDLGDRQAAAALVEQARAADAAHPQLGEQFIRPLSAALARLRG